MIPKLRLACVFFAGAFLLLAGVLLVSAVRGPLAVLFPGGMWVLSETILLWTSILFLLGSAAFVMLSRRLHE